MDYAGYDFDVVGQDAPELKCPICLLLLRDVQELPCSHTVCTVCLVKWENQTPRLAKFLMCLYNNHLY